MGEPHFRESAAILLVRGHGTELQVYWVRRSDQVSFMPGFHAFVGGVVGPGDGTVAMDGVDDDRARALRACAIRETFEEIGVLLAREGRRDAATLAEARERLLCGEAKVAAFTRELGRTVHAADLS